MKHRDALYVQDRVDCVGRPGMGLPKYSVNMTLFHPTLDIQIYNICKDVRGGELVFHAAFSLLYKLTLVS